MASSKGRIPIDAMDHHEDIDLTVLADRLQDLERRLETQVRPTREKLEALGPMGLFALAADEERRAEQAMLDGDRARRRMHLVAARAAQQLAELQVSDRSR